VREIGLLQAVGYDERHIRKLFFSEAVLLVTIGSLVGVLGATAYGELMMTGLRTWWRGAVGTTSLTLHLSSMSLIAGAAGCVIAALACLWRPLRSLRAPPPRGLLSGSLLLNPPSLPAGSARSRIAFGTFLISVATAIGLIVASSRNLIDRTGGF